MPPESAYWVAFSQVPSLGLQKIKKLLTRFSSLRAAWTATARELLQCGLGDTEVAAILARRLTVDPAELLGALEQLGIRTACYPDDDYPPLLREIHPAPALLYYRGRLPSRDELLLAVVGTRKTTAYGREIASQLAERISQSGIGIVSGLAIGIDTLAHAGALAGGGRTYAVLGCGVDQVYPRTNCTLAENILRGGGALISEYPPGTPPLKQHFPARNRIISGLAKGVLLIEGGQDSGSLITARFAVDQNRDVLAVPGNITNAAAAGSNNLIKMGAAVVTGAEDVLRCLGRDVQTAVGGKKVYDLRDASEEKIVNLLSSEPTQIDEIVRRVGLPAGEVNSRLTFLEMRGIVRHMGGTNYTLSP